MATATPKPLRLAALIRVSTEKQETQGESLKTQTTQVKDAAASLSAKIVEWYGGQEHGTPGYEKVEVDRLIRDAKRDKWDAVIVAYLDRWSRDNSKSTEGIEAFTANKKRFFVLMQEYKLNDPHQRYIIESTVVIAQLLAGTQTKKSIENRIHRAKRGYPTGGHLPYGRTFNKETCKWGIDKKKHKIVQAVADRYLDGESMPALAKEYGINHSFLHRVMTKRCGTEWEIKFDDDRLDIHEVVKFEIPRLLPDSTIKAILKKAKENKTFTHGKIIHDYLLRRRMFCGHCGLSLFGQTNHARSKTLAKKRYYRHSRKDTRTKCDCNKTFVDAALIEENVMRYLFDLFGNADRIQKVVEAATPNKSGVNKLRKRRKLHKELLEGVRSRKQSLIVKASKDIFTDSEIEPQMQKLREEEDLHVQQLRKIASQLEHVPSSQTIRDAAAVLSTRLFAAKGCKFREMSWDEKRALVEKVFADTAPDGSKCGIYIEWKQDGSERPPWTYSLKGQISRDGIIPRDYDTLNSYYDYDDNSSESVTPKRKRKSSKSRGRAVYASH